jgi:hypothetical protein
LNTRTRLVLPVLLFLLHSGTPAWAAGCSKDTDCKGDRICEKGVCKDPEGAAQAAKDKVYSTRPRSAPQTETQAAPNQPPAIVVQPVIAKAKKPTQKESVTPAAH